MINHYSSNALHDARRQDLMNEAKGGWLLKRAREAESTQRKSNVARRVLPILLIGAALAIGVLLLTFATALPAAASAPNTSAIGGTWYGNMNFSDVNSVQRIEVSIEDCTAGSVCGNVQNYAVQCTWELTFDGMQGAAYVFRHTRTLAGACPASGTGYYTPQPDGSLLRVHANPQFTAEGILKQRPSASQ